ncbi:CRISPR-associated protein Cse1 [Rhodovulum steppense]|uniref:CRISPR-associated Cse1 family protein n=1 Tax=Rhodovulum steppense TaxID=540251 RepID=A0A4V2R509_9RHOB|nr:CRISPR-associated protein Cse1 [Rhodovulum steppense]TCM86554.1 CRISPR-associated Cse1 family protein [Rhodovulum steppense]
MAHDLLHDPLIQTDRDWHSLPGLMAAMVRGEVADFPALRPHQRPAWHMFLVQLAVLALDASGQREPRQTEDGWRAALRALTSDFPDDAPWQLIGEDRSRPAFLQPPDPGGLKWSAVATPDALDMLITSRNHELKREIAHQAEAQDWVFALMSLQTMEGYGGGGGTLNGIARMNKGNSSRVLLGLAPARPGSAEIDPSAWWARDVRRLLAGREGLAGKALLWLCPWPEGRSLDLYTLDPLFIEVCRRIRLTLRDGRMAAERSTSKGPRVAAKEARGNTGDPWAPIHLTEGKSLTLGERDWTHELLVDLLYRGDWQVPLLAQPSQEEEAAPMLLVAEAFSRGNSKTDGFRSRIVPVPKAMVGHMLGARPRNLAEGILEDVKAVSGALSHSLQLASTEGDPEKLKTERKGQASRAKLSKYSAPACEALRREADRRFFAELWVRLAETTDQGIGRLRRSFLDGLAKVARAEFAAALPGIPCATLMRPRAEVRARRALEAGLRKAMKDFKQPEGMDV